MTDLVGGLAFPTVPDVAGLSGLHELLAFAMIGLLVLHIAGALKHQLIDRDVTAGRMPPFKQPRG